MNEQEQQQRIEEIEINMWEQRIVNWINDKFAGRRIKGETYKGYGDNHFTTDYVKMPNGNGQFLGNITILQRMSEYYDLTAHTCDPRVAMTYYMLDAMKKAEWIELFQLYEQHPTMKQEITSELIQNTKQFKYEFLRKVSHYFKRFFTTQDDGIVYEPNDRTYGVEVVLVK